METEVHYLCGTIFGGHSSMNGAILPLLDHNWFFSLIFKVNRNPTHSSHTEDNLLERRVKWLELEALDGCCRFDLPTAIACYEIPDNKDKIPTPEEADKFIHLQYIAGYLMPLDSEIYIFLWLDMTLMMHIRFLSNALNLLALHTPINCSSDYLL